MKKINSSNPSSYGREVDLKILWRCLLLNFTETTSLYVGNKLDSETKTFHFYNPEERV